jgi:heat shock protein HspQ
MLVHSCNSCEKNLVHVGNTKLRIGQVVRHKMHIFRGIIYDVEILETNLESLKQFLPPEMLAQTKKPFYHILAETGTTFYSTYASEDSLISDLSLTPLQHPEISLLFTDLGNNKFELKPEIYH